jgi:glucose-1-phosphate adenylyltransferase
MDLLKTAENVFAANPDWKIYSRNPVLPPHYAGSNSKIINSIISEGCVIEGEIESSVIFDGVKTETGTAIRNSIIMHCSSIGKGSVITNAIIAENVKVGRQVTVGSPGEITKEKSHVITVIGNNAILEDGAVINKNTGEAAGVK